MGTVPFPEIDEESGHFRPSVRSVASSHSSSPALQCSPTRQTTAIDGANRDISQEKRLHVTLTAAFQQ